MKDELEKEMELLKAKSEVISAYLWYVNPDWLKVAFTHAYAAGKTAGQTRMAMLAKGMLGTYRCGEHKKMMNMLEEAARNPPAI